MKSPATVALLAACLTLTARAYDQPEVKFYVERAEKGQVLECPVLAGSLGESLETVLMNRARVTAKAAPLDQQGRSQLSMKIYSPERKLVHEKTYSAKLAQQKPSFQFGGITLLVESESLLKTSRNSPSWREFDTRVRASAPEHTNNQRPCAPLLGAAVGVRSP